MTSTAGIPQPRIPLVGVVVAACLAACNGSDGPPQLTPATGGTLASCTDLATRITFANTTITAANAIAAGTLTVAGTAVPAHCQILGRMNQRTSTVDGNSYAIGFEMRLPTAWNGRFFYQANGGIDGSVATAAGGIGGGGPLTNALQMGFAVISSDAGHAGSLGPFFGIDPQARLDYGYNAVAQLTPMAKSAITTAYGRGPDRSYFGGCSNGGRHALVAAARYADQYDGIFSGDPGFNLPKAAVAQLYGVKQYGTVATANTAAGLPDISTAFSAAELTMVGNAVLAKCDALDGVTDGLVSDIKACQAAFKLDSEVPTCTGARTGACLTAAQKTVLGNVHTGARNTAGTALYSSFPYDAGIGGANWRVWKFSNSINLDPGAVAFIFTAPPTAPAAFTSGQGFAIAFNLDTDAPKISATSGIYTESPMSFMTPPNPTDLSKLKNRGAKLMVYHGTSDPIFSSDDTTAWYDGLRAANGGDATDFARFYRVPGMNHCSGGPATDQFNMLNALVSWVEQGTAPDTVLATARGAGNTGGVNAELPGTWAAARTRPLCPYPLVARYKGSGDVEAAANFSCQ